VLPPQLDRRDVHLSRTARRTALALAWLLATAVGLLVAATTKIGPVLLSVSDTHGVHLGDVAAFAACYGAVVLLGRRRPRAQRRHAPGQHRRLPRVTEDQRLRSADHPSERSRPMR
jgi:hypothetical protein